MGSYTDTAHYVCPKSALILAGTNTYAGNTNHSASISAVLSLAITYPDYESWATVGITP